MKKRTPIVIGNWKMNPNSLAHAKQIFIDIKTGLGRKKRTTIIAIAPPFPFMEAIYKLNVREQVELWSQTIAVHEAGAHTGNVSLAMAASVGAAGVIIGHSERRAAGESDEDIAAQITLALKQSFPVTVCIGERERDCEGAFYSFLETQIETIVAAVPKRKLHLLTIAYEPIWAIGSGAAATPADVQEMKLFIQKYIADRCGRSALTKVAIVYGGSVTNKNADALIREGEVDGFLVGGASLRASEFISIIDTVEAYVQETIS